MASFRDFHPGNKQNASQRFNPVVKKVVRGALFPVPPGSAYTSTPSRVDCSSSKPESKQASTALDPSVTPSSDYTNDKVADSSRQSEQVIVNKTETHLLDKVFPDEYKHLYENWSEYVTPKNYLNKKGLELFDHAKNFDELLSTKIQPG